jgi:hypothetical protein
MVSWSKVVLVLKNKHFVDFHSRNMVIFSKFLDFMMKLTLEIVANNTKGSFLHRVTWAWWGDLVCVSSSSISLLFIHVRIRVRIVPPYPLVCCKRRLNGGVPSDETGKSEVPCRSRCGTIKIPPCSKALSAEHRLKFAALHRQWWRLHISEKLLSGT